jgi:AbrB family looped-hinge helix DNA binding protein
MKITVDRAARIVLPKPVRDKMRLTPGSTLELESEGEHIALRAVRPQAALHKEFGVWVFQGASADESIPDLLQESRENGCASCQVERILRQLGADCRVLGRA